MRPSSFNPSPLPNAPMSSLAAFHCGGATPILLENARESTNAIVVAAMMVAAMMSSSGSGDGGGGGGIGDGDHKNIL